jgi:hypothetical protein
MNSTLGFAFFAFLIAIMGFLALFITVPAVPKVFRESYPAIVRIELLIGIALAIVFLVIGIILLVEIF